MSDGVDPEWALWYSGYLQTRLWDRAGLLPSRSRLVFLLVEAAREFAAEPEWPQRYAEHMLDDLRRGS